MKTMKNFIYILLAGIAFYSCSEDQIELYQDGRYIQFEDHFEDTTASSFFFYPNATTFDLPMVLDLVGDTLETDMQYSIKVNTEFTDAPEGSFELESMPMFEKGFITDTTYITFKKVPEFDTREYMIVLDIVDTEGQLKVGEIIHSRKTFKISSMIAQPEWWNEAITRYYLGVFSGKKYEEFIRITGETDLTGWEGGPLIEVCREFKYELIRLKEAGTPVLMEDGTDMLSTVKIIG